MGSFEKFKNDFLAKAAQLLDENKQLTDAIAGFVQSHGGLAELVKRFQEKGISNVVLSSLTVEQIHAVLDREKIKSLAAKVGLTPEQMAMQLAILLPAVIAKFSANKKPPAPST